MISSDPLIKINFMGQKKTKSFDSYTIEYGITNPNGRDLARIYFFRGTRKVGQALFGSAIAPGSYADISQNEEIHLYYPLSHFENIFTLLRTKTKLSLFVELDELPPGGVSAGGIQKKS